MTLTFPRTNDSHRNARNYRIDSQTPENTSHFAMRITLFSSLVWTDKLQRFLNAAARVITNTQKFDRGLTRILRDDLHWLDLPRRVSYKLCLTTYKCLHGMAPQYLAELCRPVSDIQGRRHLRSATLSLGLLDKPRYELETYGRRAFSYAGPSAWNSLPAHLRSQNVTINNFRHSLKTFFSYR